MLTVLRSARQFSTTGGAEMEARERALALISGNLRDRLASLPRPSARLRVKQGGRQANYSPTAWVRVFEPAFSPRATEGFYLVYLFAADGSAVYLSLNQGTSELRSNAMRPVNDRRVLSERAMEARLSLEPAVLEGGLPELCTRIDLRSASVAMVGPESRKRIQNYEDANIYAIGYPVDALPDEERLFADLEDLLPLLFLLYGDPSVVRGGNVGRERSAEYHSGSVARQSDPAIRRAVELYAEDRAEELLASDGWSVSRVGPFRCGYDLLCVKAERELHLEVKGTVTQGEEVVLTPNEVRHVLEADCAAEHGLFVCSAIDVVPQSDPVECFSGKPRLLHPWRLDPTDVVPTQYVYRLPVVH